MELELWHKARQAIQTPEGRALHLCRGQCRKHGHCRDACLLLLRLASLLHQDRAEGLGVGSRCWLLLVVLFVWDGADGAEGVGGSDVECRGVEAGHVEEAQCVGVAGGARDVSARQHAPGHGLVQAQCPVAEAAADVHPSAVGRDEGGREREDVLLCEGPPRTEES